MLETRTLLDRILAAVVGCVAFALLMIWAFPCVHPYAWNDMAVGCGALPQGKMLPGLGVYVSHLVFAVFPFKAGMAANVVFAKLMMAACGWMVYGILFGTMRLVSGVGVRDVRRRTLAVRVASFVGALSFCLSEPIWNAAQGLTGSTLQIFVVVVAFKLFVKLLETARLGYAVGALIAMGFFCAETPLGWFALGLGLFFTWHYLQQPQTDAWKDFLAPVVMQHTKWTMTFSFIGAFLVGAFFDTLSFVWLDGMHAVGMTYGELPILYFKVYWGMATSSANPTGACLFVLAAVLPFALASLLSSVSTDEDRYLSLKFSIVYFIVGAIAFLQLSPFEFAWFWNIVDSSVVSRQIITFSSLLSAVTLSFSLYVLCVEIFCRDYNYIESVAALNYFDDDDDEEGNRRPGYDDVASVRLSAGRVGMLIIPLLIVAVILPGRRLPCDRALLDVIHAFVCETVDEAAGTKYVFTDGSYDAAIRLESRRRGGNLIPVSLMSDNSRHDAYVRQLGSDNFEDRMSLETGAAEALRTWVVSKSEKLNEVSVQLAFELFQLNRRLKPMVYGLLVRPTGGDENAAQASVARCRALGDRIVALHENGTWRHAKNAFLKDRFLFAQFRLAVMSRLRAINLDAQKKVKESIEEIAYSDKLNANNPSLVKILKRMDWVRRQSGEALTPREGLEVAMKRADFAMARRYAMPVLRDDPDEPNANFAVGMGYYAEEQFAKAEDYLKRVLKRSSKEPAVYNNLALLYLKTGRLEEAEEYAKKAIALLPDSPEVKDTVNQVNQAREKRTNPLRK